MIQKEGPGWRLAKDTSRKYFPVLIGGDRWAIELAEPEWNSLLPVIDELVTQHKELENQLMKEESICLEIGREPWWGCIDGDSESWSLQLILESKGDESRGFEAYWPAPAAKAITAAMRIMWDCNE